MHEDVLYALFLQRKFRHEFVATAEGGLEVELHTGHNGIDTALVEFGKTHTTRTKKFVAGMLRIVLIVGIVDNALKVALIIAHLEV